ncbi:MAG: hypothetical protein Harvfovirus5_17 [Harvfovirus sp.]|uniref:Uncharacterized protein n=1 Tax=Harvfovirus sp. TaxID=2487768 RepID=A0A3G5A4F9_9VIRU|nr:MAG: hypothetical protein Harvfovirus5_17 [Harvfovirus sp.]
MTDFHSVDVTWFSKPSEDKKLDPEWLCWFCKRVPFLTYGSTCCGITFCLQCIETWKQTNENKCPDPACSDSIKKGFSIRETKFLASQFENFFVSCVNYPAGCQEKILFGLNGVTYKAHQLDCKYAMISCKECKESVLRGDYALHHGEKEICQHVLVPCEECDVPVKSGHMAAHIDTSLHKFAALEKMRKAFATIESLKVEAKSSARFFEGLVHLLKLEFMSHTVTNWKKIVLSEYIDKDNNGVETKKICSRTYTSARPYYFFNKEFWFKIQKNEDGSPGFYLCTALDERKNEMNITYRLVILHRKKRGKIVFESQIFNADFGGNEGSWGLGKTLELKKLEELGGYDPHEDILEFGIILYPGPETHWPSTVKEVFVLPVPLRVPATS